RSSPSGREPSEFMTTTDQLPSSTSQVSCRVPGPDDDASQKPSSPGGFDGGPPSRSSDSSSNGPKRTWLTSVRRTSPRYPSTASSRPMPTNSGPLPGAGLAVTRTRPTSSGSKPNGTSSGPVTSIGSDSRAKPSDS